jgi:apolipoprotein N-acyltransferase
MPAPFQLCTTLRTARLIFLAWGLPFLLGAVSVFGFAPFHLFPLPILALAGFLYVSRLASPAQGFRRGWAFGLGWFLAGVSWVYVSLHDFGMMPAPLAAFATLFFCLGLALVPAAVGYAQARLPAAEPARLLLVVPALWTLGEWFRGWVFTGFPWLSLGYSQLDGPLSGLAPVLGVFGVSLAAAAAAGALVMLVRRRRVLVAAGVLAALAGATAALRGIEWTSPHGEPLAVALLQGNIPQAMKFEPGRFAATLETYARLAERSQARLVVLPETAIPRFLHEVDPAYLERLERLARARDGDVLAGVPILEGGRRYYNAVVSLGTGPSQAYAKAHLVPFGEFVPPGFGWIVAILRIPLSDFARGGAAQAPLRVAGQRVAVNICYEDAFGEEIIRQLPEATLLVNVSNVAWFGDSLAPAQHLRISRMRSIETGRTMLRATNTGVTAIVDPRGAVVARLPSFTEGVLEGRVRGYAGTTPYMAAGNVPVVLGSLGVVAAAALAGRRRARKASAGADLRA